MDNQIIGTYKKKKIAEVAKSAAVKVFNSAPISEEKDTTLARARDAAFKATDCPSAKSQKKQNGNFLVDVDEEEKWCHGSGTRRNKAWIYANIRGSKETLRKICDRLEQGLIQSSTDRVTKAGKKVKIESKISSSASEETIASKGKKRKRR